MKKPIVIVFNMTPRSGKDIAVKHLIEHFGEDKAMKHTFADKVVDMTLSVYDISRQDWDARYNEKSSTGVWMKDVPWSQLMERGEFISQRQALKIVAEQIVKPVFGNDIFGYCVSKDLDPNKINFISDGGFNDEVKAVADVSTMLVIKRDRLGNGWEGDSRGWIDESIGDRHITIPNCVDVDVDTYLAWCRGAIKGWLESINYKESKNVKEKGGVMGTS